MLYYNIVNLTFKEKYIKIQDNLIESRKDVDKSTKLWYFIRC